MTELNPWASSLTEAVGRLAAPPLEQLRYLDELGAEPDELALEFDDYFRVVEEYLGDDDRRVLEKINQKLSTISSIP